MLFSRSGEVLLAAAIMCTPCSAATRPQDTTATVPDDAQRDKIRNSYGRLPLQFETNEGQTDGNVRFLSRGNGYSLFLTSSEAAISLRAGGDHAVLRTRLVGGNPRPEIAGEDRLPGTANYFVGNDPSQWHAGIATYREVRYHGAYPGIDLVFYGNQQQLEYDFIVAPGGTPNVIRMEFAGADKILIDRQGDLLLTVGDRVIREHKPVVYQEIDGQRRAVKGRYVLAGKALAGFSIGRYDTTRPLVIDPVLAYSTYLGGNDYDWGAAIAVDADGNAYVTGGTESADFPTKSPLPLSGPSAFQTALAGGADVFVTKLNPSGTALVYSTYLGGSGNDRGWGIAVDASGNAFITGDTNSTDFPTYPFLAFQDKLQGAFDAFVTKLNPDGVALVYSTYLGGSEDQYHLTGRGASGGTGIAVDAAGNAYVTGSTNSANFPVTTGAFRTTLPGANAAFVTKLRSDAFSLIYSTYLGGTDNYTGGGNGTAAANSIALDTAGDVYVTGYTDASNFPVTAGAFQTALSVNMSPIPSDHLDAFVTKLNPDGSALAYSTYLGGNAYDWGSGIAIDTAGNAYVAGTTQSTNYPVTPGAFQTSLPGATAAFVTKLNTSGAGLVYSTYLGGSGDTLGNAIAVDKAGNASVTGNTDSPSYPITTSAVQTTNTGIDVFVTKLSLGGTLLRYSTYLGGSNLNDALGIAVDTAGNVYVVGSTTSTDYPTTLNAFKTVLSGTKDPVVTKLQFPGKWFKVGYAVNLPTGDSFIDLSNEGALGASLQSGTAAGITGALCANVYAFTPDEQMVSCCSCPVTPNGLVSLSARNDLASNTLTPAVPAALVIKLIATVPVAGSCTNSAAAVGTATLAEGMAAWGTTIHATPAAGTYGVTETSFADATLSTGELTRLGNLCNFILANGSGFGICRACRLGGLGAVGQ